MSPYKGDFYLNGNGTLPTGETNLTSNHPGHIRIVSAANPLEYYDQTRNIDPVNLHDRGAGYGIIRIKKDTRDITFEAWPIHADPEFPQTGAQFPDWPVTIKQSDNDGRTPTGFLPVIHTHWESNPAISVYDEGSGELVYSMRFPGNIVRLPVYDNGTNYRVEISYDNAPAETLVNQTVQVEGPAAIHSFTALRPSIITGHSTLLQWNVEGVTTLDIDNGLGDVTSQTINGIGHLSVSPTSDTTYTLTLNGATTAQTTVNVFPARIDWLGNHFTLAELQDDLISGNSADPDGDGFTNEEEFNFQTNPQSANSVPFLGTELIPASDSLSLKFTSAFPLLSSQYVQRVQSSTDLINWTTLPPASIEIVESNRNNTPSEGTSQITIEVTQTELIPEELFYRSTWILKTTP